MFIIFGTRGVNKMIKHGDFMCPQCATTKKFRHLQVRRFFTLFFIPLIPLGTAGEYVECMSCKGTFVPRVLDYKPSLGENQFQSQYEKAMRHSMILMMLADGIIDAQELVMVRSIINKFGHNDISADELSDLVEEVQLKKEPVGKYLSVIAPSLNEHGKELIIKCGLTVAASDGHVDQSELKMIDEMASAMEMSKSHLKGITSEFFEGKEQLLKA